MRLRILGCLCCFLLLAGLAHAESSFDRELVVKNKARATQVEAVLKELLGAYENEDARDFLDYVSEDRFRQDYLVFTDAIYEDFRTYEIHRVDYWVDRVVADHIKQFLYVKWEKRYESLDDAAQLNETGYSRFVFDEVNGKYLLIELAGNDLFGSSLAEWTAETPTIAGQEVAVSNTPAVSNAPAVQGDPDLVVTSAINDGNGNLMFTVANQGTGDAGSCSLYVYSSGCVPPFSFSCTPTPMTLTVPAITAGQSVPVTSLGAGQVFTNYTLDSTHAVTESNESNNTGAVNFTGGP